MTNIDFKALGEYYGRAWRLGHINASIADQRKAGTEASRDIPKEGKQSFKTGWAKGNLSVRTSRRKA